MSSTGCGSSGSARVHEELVALLRDQEAMAHLVRGVAALGLSRHDALDLIHEVIGEMYMGDLPTPPEDVSLAVAVLASARRVHRRQTKARARERQVPLSEIREDETPSLDPWVEAAPAEGNEGVDVAELLARIRHGARRDPDVLELLTANARGLVRGADVREATGLSAARHRNARRRRQRYAVAAMAEIAAGPGTQQDAAPHRMAA
jgi:hypothetical protein